MVELSHGVATGCLSDLPASEAVRPRRASGHVIMLITTGAGSHAIDFIRYPCRPGTLLWGRPGQVHQFGREPGLDATLVTFGPAALPPLPGLDHLLDDPFAPACWQLTGEDEDAIVSEITQIATDCARYAPGPGPGAPDAGPDRWVRTELLRHQLAVLLTRVGGLVPVPEHSSPARSLVARLRRELAGRLGNHRVEEYAERLGCSVRTLTRACLEVTGRSAKQLIDERVALEAKRALATTDLPVAAVGRQLGFPEPTNFGRFFLRETGRAPGEFRAELTRTIGEPIVPAARSALPGRLRRPV